MRLSFPAHALSRSATRSFSLHQRGVNWLNATGAMSLTIHRPPRYRGGSVRLSIMHEVAPIEAGTISFSVTPISFSDGASFETYGGVSTEVRNAPESNQNLFEQSAVLVPGASGIGSFNGDWWYFEITRGGTYAGATRVMAVDLKY
jgi:hypothetical protein